MSAWMMLVFVGLGALCMFVVMQAIPQDVRQCRVDALNAMCGVYGNRSGGAKDVLSDNGGFYVVCANDEVLEAWKDSTRNLTNMT